MMYTVGRQASLPRYLSKWYVAYNVIRACLVRTRLSNMRLLANKSPIVCTFFYYHFQRDGRIVRPLTPLIYSLTQAAPLILINT